MRPNLLHQRFEKSLARPLPPEPPPSPDRVQTLLTASHSFGVFGFVCHASSRFAVSGSPVPFRVLRFAMHHLLRQVFFRDPITVVSKVWWFATHHLLRVMGGDGRYESLRVLGPPLKVLGLAITNFCRGLVFAAHRSCEGS